MVTEVMSKKNGPPRMRPSPLICPAPPGTVQPDCPLYEQRLAYGPDEPLRRAVLTDRSGADLAALIRAEPAPEGGAAETAEAANRPQLDDAALPPPDRAALPAPESMSILDQLHREKESR